ncbi:hypothetical protein BGX26_005477 [Mortierella sp. AD094]|nr:hypothetical protein BGX26_005477 [Mortierella sp. AD094]
MTLYIQTHTKSKFEEILLTETHYSDIISEFKAYHTARVEAAIKDKNLEIIKEYSQRLRISGSKSSIVEAITKTYGSADRYCYVLFKRQMFKSDKKDSLVFPASALNVDNVNTICINTCLANILAPFKRFFNVGLTKEEEFWNDGNVVLNTDTDTIIVREESIINGYVWPKFNQYHRDDLESAIKDVLGPLTVHVAAAHKPGRTSIWDANVVPLPWKYDESPMFDIPTPRHQEFNSDKTMAKLSDFLAEYAIKADISKSGRFLAIIPTEKHICPICDRVHDSTPLFAYVVGWSKLVVRCRRNRAEVAPKPDIEYDLDIEPPPKVFFRACRRNPQQPPGRGLRY